MKRGGGEKEKYCFGKKKIQLKKQIQKKPRQPLKGAGLRFRRRRIRLISFGLSYCLLSEY